MPTPGKASSKCSADAPGHSSSFSLSVQLAHRPGRETLGASIYSIQLRVPRGLGLNQLLLFRPMIHGIFALKIVTSLRCKPPSPSPPGSNPKCACAEVLLMSVLELPQKAFPLQGLSCSQAASDLCFRVKPWSPCLQSWSLSCFPCPAPLTLLLSPCSSHPASLVVPH